VLELASSIILLEVLGILNSISRSCSINKLILNPLSYILYTFILERVYIGRNNLYIINNYFVVTYNLYLVLF